jgi:hypothetical protein
MKCEQCGFRNSNYIYLCEKCCNLLSPVISSEDRDGFGTEFKKLGEEINDDDPRFEALVEIMKLEIKKSEELLDRKSAQLDNMRSQAGLTDLSTLESDERDRKNVAWIISSVGLLSAVIIIISAGQNANQPIVSALPIVLTAGIVGMLLYSRIYKKCPACGERSPHSRSFLGRNELGYEDGWHTETRSANTSTQFRDNRGTPTGTADSSTSYSVSVPHRVFYYQDNFKCNYCAFEWFKNLSRRVNL